jgi:hypothetical protein
LGMRGAKLWFAAFTREAELPGPGSQAERLCKYSFFGWNWAG